MFSFQPSPCPTDSDTTADHILDNCSETDDYTVGDDRRDSKGNEKVVLERSTKEPILYDLDLSNRNVMRSIT